MQIQGQGCELLVTLLREDRRGTNRRTVGRYQVYHDGAAIQALSGMCAETRAPVTIPRPTITAASKRDVIRCGRTAARIT